MWSPLKVTEANEIDLNTEINDDDNDVDDDNYTYFYAFFSSHIIVSPGKI